MFLDNHLLSDSNKLLGSISSKNCNIDNLAWLYFDRALWLKYYIIASIRQLLQHTNLIIIFINNRLFSDINGLTGSIPSELGNFEKLTELFLSKEIELNQYNMFSMKQLPKHTKFFSVSLIIICFADENQLNGLISRI